MTVDEWELSPENVDVGGCRLENPMDLVSMSYEALYGNRQENDYLADGGDELPDMGDNDQGGEASGFMPAELSMMNDEVHEPEHAGFISELDEGELLLLLLLLYELRNRGGERGNK